VLQCRGCEAIFFQTEEISSAGDIYVEIETGETSPVPIIEQWPAPEKRKKPDWHDAIFVVDHDLGMLLRDVYGALNNDLPVLAAIAIRTMFDRASELLGVQTKKSFADKLGELVLRGKIGEEEGSVLNVLTDAGSAAAHRGWRPTTDDLATMTGIIENFLYRTFVIPRDAQALKTRVPPRAWTDKKSTGESKV
jgi:hypothetical protein